MVSGVGDLGSFDNFDYSDSEWFYTEKSFTFQPSKGPDEEFTEGLFLITVDHGQFIFFDGRVFDHDIETTHSCMICLRRNTELKDMVTVATFQMTYDLNAEGLIRKWSRGEDCEPLNHVWQLLCSGCLEDLRSVYDKFNDDNLAAHLL